MPSERERRYIEDNNLAIRKVPDGGEVLSGSCYYLTPSSGDWSDWDARLLATARTYKQSGGGGRLHLLRNVPLVVSGQFNSRENTLDYGRVTGRGESIASAGLFGTEKKSNIANWVKVQITSAMPQEVVLDLGVAQGGGPSTIDWIKDRCCAIVHVFTCCRPSYDLIDEDEFDMT